MLFSALLFTGLAPPALAAQAASQCLRYEPDTVSIEAPVYWRTYPGPPNYESIKKGDTAERGLYLGPNPPICMATGADKVLMPAMTGIKDIQLVADTTAERWLRRQQGSVTVRGTLSAAASGHHHAPLVLSVTSYVDSSRPQDSWLLDSAVKAMGLESLRTKMLPQGRREIRVWLLGGLVLPHNMVRVRDGAAHDDGEVFAFWPEELGHQSKLEGKDYRASMRESVACLKRWTAAGMVACRQPGVSASTWRATSDSLDAQQVCDLVDEADLPPTGEFTEDGFTLTVECRTGLAYRSYTYRTPAAARGPEYARADRIWRIGVALRPPLAVPPRDTMSSRLK